MQFPQALTHKIRRRIISAAAAATASRADRSTEGRSTANERHPVPEGMVLGGQVQPPYLSGTRGNASAQVRS